MINDESGESLLLFFRVYIAAEELSLLPIRHGNRRFDVTRGRKSQNSSEKALIKFLCKYRSTALDSFQNPAGPTIDHPEGTCPAVSVCVYVYLLTEFALPFSRKGYNV